jgi:small-conductance mechanosensitive channel
MHRIVRPLAVIAGCAVILLAGAELGLAPATLGIVEQVTRITLWLATAWLVVRLSMHGVNRSFARRSGRQPPKLLLDLLAGVIWIAVLSALSVVEFGVSPSAALATSGVLIAVVGFAVRSLLADLFYGITMAIERPFEIGDWVQLADGATGRVEEMTWRAVKLVSHTNNKIVVPNAKLATEQIVNFDQPQSFWRKSHTIILSYEVAPAQVAQLLETAVREVPESTNIPRPPEIRILGYHEQGVEWELRYWVPDYNRGSEVAQKVQEALLRNMRFAGIRVPRPREDIFLAELVHERESDRSSTEQWIQHVELFAPVSRDQRLELQQNARRLQFVPGDDVVRQGEVGDSLFVILQGSFEVLITGESGAEDHAGHMGAGSIFGELSLLTGSPRSATVRAVTDGVVYEITKSQVEPLLTGQPDLARKFAMVLADRRLADTTRNGADSQATLEEQRRGIITNILNGARSFFRLAA